MLGISSASPPMAISVALPISSFRRQTKPGEASASALIRSSASKNGWTWGSPCGAMSRPMLICARCQAALMSVVFGAPPAPHVDDDEQEQPDHVDEVPVPRRRLEPEVLARGEVAEVGAAQADDQEDRADEHVEAVEPGRHVERRAVGVAAEPERGVGIFVSLDAGEQHAEDDRQPQTGLEAL